MTIARRRSRLVAVIADLLLCACLVSCTWGTRKLDEAVFHGGPGFKLKVVRYYENLPLHFSGEVFRVQCSSAQTTASPGHKTQDPGWVTLGNGAALGSKSAAELVERVRRDYLVIDDQTLAWVGNGVNVSFNACGEFHGWYPTSVPTELVDPVARADYGYEDVRVRGGGQISFTVRSKAFKGNRSFRVESRDFGHNWTLTANEGI